MGVDKEYSLKYGTVNAAIHEFFGDPAYATYLRHKNVFNSGKEPYIAVGKNIKDAWKIFFKCYKTGQIPHKFLTLKELKKIEQIRQQEREKLNQEHRANLALMYQREKQAQELWQVHIEYLKEQRQKGSEEQKRQEQVKKEQVVQEKVKKRVTIGDQKVHIYSVDPEEITEKKLAWQNIAQTITRERGKKATQQKHKNTMFKD